MPRVTLRRTTAIALAMWLAGTACLSALAALGRIDVGTGASLTLTGLVLVTLGVLGISVRQTESRLQRRLHDVQVTTAQLQSDLAGLNGQDGWANRINDSVNEVTTLVTDVRGVVTDGRADLIARISEAGKRLEQLSRDAVAGLGGVSEGIAGIDRRVAGLETSLSELPAKIVEPVKQAISRAGATQATLRNRLYANVEAQANLRYLITPRAPMPALGGWALDADILHSIATALWNGRPELVVECGSGASSVWMGYFAERLGRCRVVALEHDERYAQATRNLVVAHRLQEVVDVRYAPLQPWSDGSDGAVEYRWYAQEAWEDLKGIGLLLVDGPPAATGRQARYPALPLLLSRCSGDAVIVLDDTGRADEKALSDRWLAEWPELERTMTAQGFAHTLRRSMGGD